MLSKLISAASVAGISATCMYFLDPVAGRRRRVLLRNQIASRTSKFSEFLDVALRDLKNRTIGLYGEARYRLRGRKVDDDQLRSRIAARIGHCISHPRSIDISVDDGYVYVSGKILQYEIDKLIKAISSVPGVRDVESDLEVYTDADDVPELQGGSRRRSGSDVFQNNWAPSTRLLSGLIGGTAAIDGLRRGHLVGYTEAWLGSTLLGRSIVNQPIKDLLNGR